MVRNTKFDFQINETFCISKPGGSGRTEPVTSTAKYAVQVI